MTKTPAVFGKSYGPGPAYAVHHRITRHGLDGTPVYSILGRARDRCESDLLSRCYSIINCYRNGMVQEALR